jgi:hypothetical protein
LTLLRGFSQKDGDTRLLELGAVSRLLEMALWVTPTWAARWRSTSK